MKTWFITGISSGFGREMAEQLLSQGDRVAGTVRDLEVVKGLKEKYGDQLWLDRLDVTDISAIRRVVNKVFADLGSVDVIVNNAGYGLFGAAEEITDEELLHQINTNLIGSIQVARAALPHLRKQGGGRIIQLSTYGGQATHPGASLYHASKWGIEGFMESLSKEIAPFKIGVTIVEPGGAPTDFRAGGARVARKMDAYDDSPAAMVRGIKTMKTLPPGDPKKMVKLMIDSVELNPAPLRLVLGSDAYSIIHNALGERMVALETQKGVAFSSDAAK